MTISMRQGGAAAASGKLEHVTQHRIEGLIFLEHGARIGDEAGSVRLNAHSFWGWGLWDSVTAIPGSSNGAFCPIHSQGPIAFPAALSILSVPAAPISSGTAYLCPVPR